MFIYSKILLIRDHFWLRDICIVSWSRRSLRVCRSLLITLKNSLQGHLNNGFLLKLLKRLVSIFQQRGVGGNFPNRHTLTDPYNFLNLMLFSTNKLELVMNFNNINNFVNFPLIISSHNIQHHLDS